MESKYIDDLEAWIKARGGKKPDANVAAFLAVRDMVRDRLEVGYSATTIYDFLRENQRIDICYDTFLKYVHRYVRPPRKTAKARNIAKHLVKLAEANHVAAIKQSTPSPIRGFTFNPTPNREDLF